MSAEQPYSRSSARKRVKRLAYAQTPETETQCFNKRLSQCASHHIPKNSISSGRFVSASCQSLKDSKSASQLQRLDNNFRQQAVVTTMFARAMSNHNILLLAAICDFGVTLASCHAMLHHRKRGLALLSTERAGRAKSRFGPAQADAQE